MAQKRIRGLWGMNKPAKGGGTLGSCLHRGVTYDEKTNEWLVTEEYVSGYVVIGRHRSRIAARAQLRKMGRSP